MRNAWVVLVVAAFGCSLADVGDEDVCSLAAQHLAACLGADMPAPGSCDATSAVQAQQVLAQDCATLQDQTRSAQGLYDAACQLLPMLCQYFSGGGSGGGGGDAVFRIGDCWQRPEGWCFDMVKVGDGCTELMEWDEWHAGFTYTECLHPFGNRCRLARVCGPFADKGQCVDQVSHHNDMQRCSEENDDNGTGTGPLDGSRFRVTDCWEEGNNQFCFHMVKKQNPSDPGACTELMEWGEWHDPSFTSVKCNEPQGNRCRQARVCMQFPNKGECINQVQHRPDSAQCNVDQPNQDPSDGESCAYNNGTNYRKCRDCGWQFCLSSGKWAACAPNPSVFPCEGGQTCSQDAYCHW
jgi:hypothetical protein